MGKILALIGTFAFIAGLIIEGNAVVTLKNRNTNPNGAIKKTVYIGCGVVIFGTILLLAAVFVR